MMVPTMTTSNLIFICFALLLFSEAKLRTVSTVETTVEADSAQNTPRGNTNIFSNEEMEFTRRDLAMSIGGNQANSTDDDNESDDTYASEDNDFLTNTDDLLHVDDTHRNPAFGKDDDFVVTYDDLYDFHSSNEESGDDKPISKYSKKKSHKHKSHKEKSKKDKHNSKKNHNSHKHKSHKSKNHKSKSHKNKKASKNRTY